MRLIIYHLILILAFVYNSTSLSAQKKGEDCPEIKNKKSVKLFDNAYNYYRTGNFAESNKLLKELIVNEPEYADAYYLLGMINIKRKDYNLAAAELYFTKLIEICPSYDAYPYFYVGKILFGREDWAGTVKYLGEFVKRVDMDKPDKKLDIDFSEAEELITYASFYNKMKSNPVPFDPKPVRGISTALDEYLAIITADNSMAFFTRRVEVKDNKLTAYRKETTFKEMFCVSKREGEGFTTGDIMPHPFNQFNNEGGATLTINNKELFYTVCSSAIDCDIYTSTLDSDGFWTEVKKMSKAINVDKFWDSQPSISSDGNVLYFSSNRPGGYGGYDLYMSRRNENGEWQQAVNMGPVINTPGHEKSPFIHTDSQTLYFSSADREDEETGLYYKGHQGMGGFDIFLSRKSEDNKWSVPKNIGYPINSNSDDLGFFVSTDGKTGYFASNKLKKEQSDWDLYSFELYKEVQPEKVLFIKGELKDEKTNEPVKANIELKNVETKKVTIIPVDETSGEYVAAVLFRNDYVMTVKKEDYAYESKYISLEDTVYEKPAVVDVEIKPIEVGSSYRLNDIYFPSNSDELTHNSLFVLDGFIEFLTENPKITIAIHGHTDDIGSDESNQVLSENRAKSVYNYILSKGIKQSRMSYKGFGESKPIASNTTEAGRAKNRRTEFVILNK